MKKLLVPVDFSETSRNAARYAAEMARDLKGSTLIFYHVFSPVAAGSDGTPMENNLEARKQVVEMALGNMVHELPEGLRISIVAEEGDSLTENLVRYVRHNGVDMIIMGLTGATRLQQILMGSNSLNMALEAVCPVLIVPPSAHYKSVRNILFATDMKSARTSTPLHQLRNVLSFFDANLHVVNIDVDHYVELTEEYKKERADLVEMLDGFNPEFYFIRIGDFVDSINTFSADKNIDLIITVPRKHGFFSALFNPSQTRRLLYHTHIPVVAIRE